MKPKTKNAIVVSLIVIVLAVAIWIVWKRAKKLYEIKLASEKVKPEINVDENDLFYVYENIIEVLAPYREEAHSMSEYFAVLVIQEACEAYFLANPQKYYQIAYDKGDTSPRFVARCVISDTVRTHFQHYHGGKLSDSFWESLAYKI